MRDFDIPQAAETISRYNLTWGCFSLNTQGPCITTENKTLDLSTFVNKTSIKLPRKILPAYSGYVFNFSAYLSKKNSTFSVTIYIMESDLPSLATDVS